MSGDGDLIDIRFRMNERMTAQGSVYIQDEISGKIATVASVPRVGRLLTQRAKIGNIAYALFRNPDDAIKSGSLVTLVVGDYRKEHIQVI